LREFCDRGYAWCSALIGSSSSHTHPGYPGKTGSMIVGHRCQIWSPLAHDHGTAGHAGFRLVRAYPAEKGSSGPHTPLPSPGRACGASLPCTTALRPHARSSHQTPAATTPEPGGSPAASPPSPITKFAQEPFLMSLDTGFRHLVFRGFGVG
jgi:hypothetical protein